MEKIKCVLIDDEKPAIDLLDKYASKIEQLQVVGKFHDPMEAYELISKQDIDLIFLDIQMPIINGISFIKTIPKPPAIVFTTAYRKYAIESYELDVVDYLLKPFGFERFLKAVNKYRNRHFKALPSESNPPTEFIFYNVNRTYYKVRVSDIHLLESLKDYTRIHTLKDRLVVRGNLSSNLKQLLPYETFIRVHRSYAIGLDHVDSYNLSTVVVKGVQIPIGHSYRESFLNRIRT